MIKIDFNNMLTPKLSDGVSQQELSEIFQLLENTSKKFSEDKPNIGFTKLPYEYMQLKEQLKLVDTFAEGMDSIVVIGIGGSDLGTRAIFRSLKHTYHNELSNSRKMYFLGDTTDPEILSDTLDVLDLNKTLIIVVSKSGNTVEQATVFIHLRELMIRTVGKENEPKHFLFLTDPESGTLRELSRKFGYNTIDIPRDVGGRFSVLSSVGMVPSHLVGLDVEQFLEGAKDLDLQLSASRIEDNIALRYAALQYLFYSRGKNISVFFNYQYSLGELAKWFRQLLAESLGKKFDQEGNEVFEGITPVAALGPTDQHSQLQLYNEGPNDKIFTFLISKETRKEIILPQDLQGFDQFDFLKGRSMQEILTGELETTVFALTKNNRPNCSIEIDRIDEYHLGQLFYFFEVSVAYLGYLLNVNTFDQPGVELSKNAMYGLLGKKGYESYGKEFEEFKRK